MFIYNTTFHIDRECYSDFVAWLRNVYIPVTVQHGALSEPRLARIIVDEKTTVPFVCDPFFQIDVFGRDIFAVCCADFLPVKIDLPGKSERNSVQYRYIMPTDHALDDRFDSCHRQRKICIRTRLHGGEIDDLFISDQPDLDDRSAQIYSYCNHLFRFDQLGFSVDLLDSSREPMCCD